MPKRKAARNDRAIEIQPSLLHSLPRPTDPEQLSVWTANVRARLTVLQGGICKLESEKQVLLSLLSDASNDVREVFTDAPSSEICPRGEVPAAESSNSLWNAAQGFPSDVLANNINESSVHPALKYDENEVKSLPPTLSTSDAVQTSDHLESRSAEFNREREEEAACPTAAFPSMISMPQKARHSDAHSGLIASIEALSHTPHAPDPDLFASESAGQPDGAVAQPAQPAQAAQPRSPSMASTILLSSEDEGQQVPGPSSGPGPAEVAERAERAVVVGSSVSVNQNCSRPSGSVALWRRWGCGILQQRCECQEDLPMQPVQSVRQVQHSNNQLEQLSHPCGLVERLQRKRGDSKGGSHDLLDLAAHQAHQAHQADQSQVTDAVDAAVAAEPADAAEGAVGFEPETKESKEHEEPSLNSESLQPESLTDEELGSFMQFFGLKPSGSRQFMIRRLHDIVDYIDGGTAWLQSIRVAPTPQKPTKVSKAKRKNLRSSPKTEPSQTSQTSRRNLEKSSPKKAKAKPKASPKATSPTAPDASSVSPDAKYEKKLDLVADAIRKDKDLYAKLLTFEPLEVREVKRRIVEIAPELRSLGEQRLRKYLDEQGFASVS